MSELAPSSGTASISVEQTGATLLRANVAIGLGYRADIDGLRGIAVASVITYHAFPALLPGGFVGVDIFFVISGFLIATLIIDGIEQHDFSFVDFYRRRIRRIFPALILVLAVCWGLGWKYLLVDEFAQVGQHIAAASAFVLNFVLWQQAGYFDTAAASKPLLHLWSLGIEEQFYLVAPAFAALIYRVRFPIFILIVLLATKSLEVSIEAARHNPIADFYSPLTRAWELMAGCALAYARLHWPAIVARGASHDWRAAIGAILIAASFLWLRPDLAFPGAWALLPVAGTCLLISTEQPTLINRVLLSSRPLVFVGLISYPLYLWHWPLLVFARILNGGASPAFEKLALIAVSVALAALTYRFIERPVRRSRAPATPLVLIGLAMAAGIIGYATYISGGIPMRLAAPLQSIRHEPDIAALWRPHRCFLEDGDQNLFASECVDDTPASAPLVVLWGDSHAAALYPGLRVAQRLFEFRLAQFTASACPPINARAAQQGSPDCGKIDAEAMRQISAMKPDIVLLHAIWSNYASDGLDATVRSLYAAGAGRVVILGDVPNWPQGLPDELAHAYRESNHLPDRLYPDPTKNNDDRIRSIAEASGAQFVSAFDVLCSRSDGCLVRVDNQLTAFDTAHLTTLGASIVAKSTIADILGPMGDSKKREP